MKQTVCTRHCHSVVDWPGAKGKESAASISCQSSGLGVLRPSALLGLGSLSDTYQKLQIYFQTPVCGTHRYL